MTVKKILLIGEFSNLHWTLAEGLRKLGHHVIVVSNGDVWKNYERDIDIKFKNISHKISFLFSFFFSNTYKGFDVVQLIGVPFLFAGERTVWNKFFFKHLKKHNKKIFLGAFGDDYYYQKISLENNLKYSPFDLIKKNDDYAIDVLKSTNAMQNFNEYLAKNVDGIIAGIYDYYISYQQSIHNYKLTMIPFPINIEKISNNMVSTKNNSKINFFIGIQARRSSWKGTDIFVKNLKELKEEFPNKFEIQIVSDIPFEEYLKMYSNCDILVDQLYSYSPAMNALTAMLQGKIVISGGEPEMYEMLDEKEIFPIINFDPKLNIKQQFLEVLKLDSEQIFNKKQESIAFVKKHHNYVDIAQKYIDFWSQNN